MATFEILCGVAALLVALYYYSTSTYDFWKKRGVPGPRPLPVLGNTKDIMGVKTSLAAFLQKIYEEYKNEPMIGLFMGRRPILVLNDPDIIKDVLIKDFPKFADRGFNVFEKTEPLSIHLFNIESERWRPLRSKLSPIFTSGKLKNMFPLIVECSDHLKIYLDKLVAKGETVECRELTAKFTTDVIGTCAFGIDMNAMAEEDSEFRQMGRKIFEVSPETIFRLKMRQYLPRIYDLLGYIIPEKNFSPFFTKIVMDTINYRKQNDIFRPDFINMLIELQKHPDKLENIKLTDSLLTAQAFVFFAAGFETSSSAMSNALYELALNHEVQDKLREEIAEYFAKNNGQLKYEDIKHLKYLDKVFKETLRKYPAGPILMRKTTSEYTFNETKVSIPKQLVLWIPIFPIHRDPNIYPNPDVFDPERFNEDAIAARHPMHYLPFGDGPRNCIGARFAVCQTKVGLITILRNHKVHVCDKTMIPYEFDPGAFLLAPKGGIYVKMTKVEN
ncbi:putative cytochrome P450 6a14 [Andrena cerasifolii]|uniref:putative cytochrome P450 6a14 n=1 Tax=Andrena cerasifolii TaxID=2819439 RepID=UPI0040382D87